MAKTIQQLESEATEIKTATNEGENTQQRVGGLFEDIIEYLNDNIGGGGGGGGTTLNRPLSTINSSFGDMNPSDSNMILLWNGSSWTYSNYSSGGGGGSFNESAMWAALRTSDSDDNKQIDKTHLKNLSWWGAGASTTSWHGNNLEGNMSGVGNLTMKGILTIQNSTDTTKSATLQVDENGNLKVTGNLYATGGVSALGYSSSGGGGGGTGGHTIVGPNGTSMTSRSNLKFTGSVNVTDDAGNNATVVNITGGSGGGINPIGTPSAGNILYYRTTGSPGAGWYCENPASVLNVGVTSITAGTGLSGGVITGTGTISLKEASSNEIGGIKIGYIENNKNYAIKLNDGKAYVNVPWSNTTYSAGTGITIDDTTIKLLSTAYVNLNGTDVGVTAKASFYAPITAGTSNYILKSNGSGAPVWTDQSNLAAGSAAQLKTTRELWGNNFNGTQSIGTSSSYASLNYVGNITMKGTIYWNGPANSDTTNHACSLNYNIGSGDYKGILWVGMVNGAPYINLGNGIRDITGSQTRIHGYDIEFNTNGANQRMLIDHSGLITMKEGLYLENGGWTSDSSYKCLRIGNGVLVWDNSKNAFKVMKYDGTAANFYATGGVSALGFSGGGSPSISSATIGTLNSTQINFAGNMGTWSIKTSYPSHPQLDFSYGGGGSGDRIVTFPNTQADKYFIGSSNRYLYWSGSNLVFNNNGTETTLV